MEGLLEAVGAPVQPSFEHWIFERSFGEVRRRLGDADYEEAVTRGRSMAAAEALSFAFDIAGVPP